MNRFYYLVIFVAVLCGFVTLASPRAFAQQAVYPNGLHGPSNVVSGIYPGTDAGNCCWFGAQSAIKVTIPNGADTLLLKVFVPQYAAPSNGQALRVQIDGRALQERCCFGSGEHEFAFALPQDVADHPVVVVRLSARSTFVPKRIGLNQDPRHLSMLLRGVAFFDSATGQRVDDSGLADLQSAPLIWLIAAGIAILALTLRRPIFGAAALALSDPFLLAHGMHGTTITLPKVALAAVAIGLLPRLRRARGASAAALWLLLGAQLLFAASMALSSLHALNHGAAARETLKALQYAGTLVVAYVAFRLDPDERVVRYSLAAVTIAVSLLALAQEFTGAPEGEMLAGHVIARIAGPLEGPNQLAGYLGVMIPALLAFAVLRPRIVFERIAIALGAAACVLTFSRAGMAALIAGVALLLLVRYVPQRRALTATVAGAIFVALLAVAVASFAGALHGTATDAIFGSSAGADRFNGGLGVRSDLWRGAYALWRSHPLLGIGPGNFELSIGRYDPGVRTHANSMYFQVLAEQGVMGLIAMLAVTAASIGAFVRRLSQPLALGACIAAVAMAFHQIVDCMWVYPKVGLMWWILLALAAAAVDLHRTEDVPKSAVA